MSRKRLSGYGAEMDIIRKIDYTIEHEEDLKRIRKILKDKKFTIDKKKQRQLDDLLIGLDRKTLANEIVKAMTYGDIKLANSLQLVYFDKYLKNKVAREANKEPETKKSGIKIYLPEQDDKGRIQTKSRTPNRVPQKD